LRQSLRGRHESASEEPKVVHSPRKQHKVGPEPQGLHWIRIRGAHSGPFAWEATQSCAGASEVVRDPYQRRPEYSIHLGINTKLHQRLRSLTGSVSQEPKVVHSLWNQHKVAPEAQESHWIRITGAQSSPFTLEATRSCARASGVVMSPHQSSPEYSIHLGSNIKLRRSLRGRQRCVSQEPKVVHSLWKQHEVAPEPQGSSRVHIRGAQSSPFTSETTQSWARASGFALDPH
jgi:hypothetical protein